MKTIFSFLSLVVCLSVNAQMSDVQSAKDISNFGGKPVRFAPTDYSIEGSYCYLPDFKKASVVFVSANPVPELMVKLNLINNEVIYLNDQNMEMAVASPIKEIRFAENGAIFRPGFPSVKNLGPETLYQVLSEGKTATLLKQYSVSYMENRPFNSATVTRSYEQKPYYFVYTGDKMIPLEKGNVNELLNAAGAQKDKLTAFIKDNNLRLKNESDYIKLIEFYNKG